MIFETWPVEYWLYAALAVVVTGVLISINAERTMVVAVDDSPVRKPRKTPDPRRVPMMAMLFTVAVLAIFALVYAWQAGAVVYCHGRLAAGAENGAELLAALPDKRRFAVVELLTGYWAVVSILLVWWTVCFRLIPYIGEPRPLMRKSFPVADKIFVLVMAVALGFCVRGFLGGMSGVADTPWSAAEAADFAGARRSLLRLPERLYRVLEPPAAASPDAGESAAAK